ncbi:MAG: hypothetical protein QXW57_03550 [Candidatus Micrarchaeaceae archaeon]
MKAHDVDAQSANWKEHIGRKEYEMDVGNFEDTVKIISRILPRSAIDYFENTHKRMNLAA